MLCTKTKFRSREDALFAIVKIKEKNVFVNNTERKAPIDSYLCPDCNSWHLTSKLSYDTLTDEIRTLKEEIIALKKRNLNNPLLTPATSEERKKELRELRMTRTYQDQKDQNHKLLKENTRIKKDNESLIIQLVAERRKNTGA